MLGDLDRVFFSTETCVHFKKIDSCTSRNVCIEVVFGNPGSTILFIIKLWRFRCLFLNILFFVFLNLYNFFFDLIIKLQFLSLLDLFLNFAHMVFLDVISFVVLFAYLGETIIFFFIHFLDNFFFLIFSLNFKTCIIKFFETFWSEFFEWFWLL